MGQKLLYAIEALILTLLMLPLLPHRLLQASDFLRDVDRLIGLRRTPRATVP